MKHHVHLLEKSPCSRSLSFSSAPIFEGYQEANRWGHFFRLQTYLNEKRISSSSVQPHRHKQSQPCTSCQPISSRAHRAHHSRQRHSLVNLLFQLFLWTRFYFSLPLIGLKCQERWLRCNKTNICFFVSHALDLLYLCISLLDWLSIRGV